MSYMFGNNISGIAERIFQKATVSLSGNERSKIISTDRTRNSSEVSNTKKKTDSKLNRIINKFRAGHKLTQEELQYLQEKAPELYQKVVRIQKQREQIEQEIKNSDSKEEARKMVTDKISMCMKTCDSGDTFSQEAMSNQFQDALKKCLSEVKSEDQKEPRNSDSSREDSLKEEDMPYKSNTYIASGDFKEESKKQNGKHMNVVV